MPRIVITVVSLVAVLLHTIAGCCAHHQHTASRPAHEPQTCQLGAHAHDHGPAHHHSDQAPIDLPSHDDCHEAHCFAMLAGKISAPDGPLLSCGLAIWAGDDEQALPASRFALSLAPRQAYGPLPLRAHLRFCVLLS